MACYGLGRKSKFRIWVGNPIGWILQNVNSSFALYKDNGIRSFEKVVLALRPGRKNSAFIEVAENYVFHMAQRSPCST